MTILVADIHHRMAEIARQQLELDETKQELRRLMEDNRQTSVVSSEEGIRTTVSVSHRTVVSVDEDRFIKTFGRKIYNRYSPRKLDKKLLEKAVQAGQFGTQEDLDLLSKCLDVSTTEGIVTVRETQEKE